MVKHKKLKRETPKLYRTLKRGVIVRSFDKKDLRWFWAMYKAGDIPQLQPGLLQDEFVQSLEILLSSAYDEIQIIEAKVDGVFRPIGTALIKTNGPLSFPTLAWFPAVSKRNIIEGSVKFLDEFRKTPSMAEAGPTRRLAVHYGSEEDKDFLTHLAKYGIIRRVGTVYDAFGDNQSAVLFQTSKVK